MHGNRKDIWKSHDSTKQYTGVYWHKNSGDVERHATPNDAQN